ncbi:HNH endonuclease [Planococcus sp. CP5-4]|uniref:HNH endonuclease n=1 Tax=unclassified Planococcus (in: firmicutes) TaxID=2662419 RepID=UPI001C249264|nr:MULTISPECIES: HNH endonuclease [unclassified Planococcus (in: firmicutes)]MBU9674960.1 HNH endonuclease [Planococcus sp. CP5-4_YE]MBV0908423.1 HNH endonuclease [Planococcus sp. CP5-4_UN]MBW6062637.1 HNH endonuclease [Planococcus sp. CP5-4]
MGVLRFTVGGAAKMTGKAAKMTITGTGKLVSKKLPETGEYLAEIAHAIVNSSVAVIDTGAQFTEGGIQTAYGALAKKPEIQNAGLTNLKEPVGRTAKGIGRAAVYGMKNVGDTGTGIFTGNTAQTKQATKNLLKMSIVIGAGYSLIDQVGGEETVSAHSTGSFTGDFHPVTEVPFEENQVFYDGTVHEGYFPVFPAEFEATLPPDSYLLSDESHIQEANLQLFWSIQENPGLADSLNFTQQDIQNLRSSTTPAGFDWHHHEEPGRIQLVREELHQQTGHIGGRAIWGGGTEYR